MISNTRLNLKFYPEIQKQFIQNLQIALQKIGTSHKTKAIHPLIEKEMVYLGYGTIDIAKKKSTKFGVFYLNGQKFSGLCADISAVTDEADLGVVVKSIEEIKIASNELSKAKTTITDHSSVMINKLNAYVLEEYHKIIAGLDYFALIDTYYYLYMDAVIEHIVFYFYIVYITGI